MDVAERGAAEDSEPDWAFELDGVFELDPDLDGVDSDPDLPLDSDPVLSLDSDSDLPFELDSGGGLERLSVR